MNLAPGQRGAGLGEFVSSAEKGDPGAAPAANGAQPRCREKPEVPGMKGETRMS